MSKKTKKKPESLFRFYVDCGRAGDICGTFAATDEEVAGAIGRTVHFDEPFGKHSELSLKLKQQHFKMLTNDQDFVAKFNAFDCQSGTNPLGLLADQEEGQ